MLLERLRSPGTLGPLRFDRDPGAPVPAGLTPRPLSGEQTNSSLIYGDSYILKVFRRVGPGVNPDLELPRALAAAGCARVPAPVAWYEAELPGGEPLTLGVLQPYLRGSDDGWQLALRRLGAGADFTAEAHALGRATAEVHSALAAALPTLALGPEQTARLAAGMTARLAATVREVPALQPYEAGLRGAFDALAASRGAGVPAQRIHGDLHLGQTLRTADGSWSLIDFEGSPRGRWRTGGGPNRPCATSPGYCAPSTTPPARTGRSPPPGRTPAGPRSARATPAPPAATPARTRCCCARTRPTRRCTRPVTSPGTAPTGCTSRWRRSAGCRNPSDPPTACPRRSPPAPLPTRSPRGGRSRERRTTAVTDRPRQGRTRAGRTGRAEGGPGSRARRAAPPHGVRPAPALAAEERARLLEGRHHDPHAVLGARTQRGGVAFRVLRPYAKAVTVVAKGLRAELVDEGDGLFSGLLPLTGVPDYRLLVTYDSDEIEVHDPYRFLPALGELDLHLIGEGRHEELWTALGSQPMEHQGVAGTRFTVWAPNALGVRVTGDFSYWDAVAYPMRSLGASGVWELFLPGVAEGALYKYEITRPDGGHTLRADPMARYAEVPPANASIVTASRYEWQDAEWMARRGALAPHQAPLSVYELHLASWRPGLSYRQLAEQLPAYVKELGFTHVELMPVAEHPFGGSWGYQITGFYAPTSRMGAPDDFRFLVDALHRAGIGVIVDWVPAHFPRDDWALAEFDGRPLYEHQDPRRAAHPDWGTLEFDYGRKEVRNFLVANAVYWCQEFHVDGLRVDAVASMLYLDYSREEGDWSPNAHGGREDLDAVALLQEMNATVYRRCPG